MHSSEPRIHSRILAGNLRQLGRLRWLVIGGCAALLISAHFGSGLVIARPIGWGALLGYALATLWLMRWHREERGIGEWQFALHLVVDLALIGAFLASTGGSANPFTLLFLLPVVIAAATLTSGPVWLITLLAGICYTLLLVAFPSSPPRHTADANAFDQHIVGMWLGLVFVAALVAYFAAWMGRALRISERNLAAARERQLRDERVLALGSLAASAAHELGTPLSTMAVLTGELAQHAGPGQRCQIETLAAQIQRCREVLQTLNRNGPDGRVEGGRAVPASTLPRLLAAQCTPLEHDSIVDAEWREGSGDRQIVLDQSLLNALSALVANALEAARSRVRIEGAIEGGQLLIRIEDDGPGVDETLKERLGREPVSTKGSLGIGSMLAHAVVERLGGTITLDDLRPTGAGIIVRLPLRRLQVARAGATDPNTP